LVVGAIIFVKELIDYNKTTKLLQSVAGRNAWDQQTMMPKQGGQSRAMEMGALEEIIHERKSGSTIRALLETCEPNTPHEKRFYELIKRDSDRAVAIPSKLAYTLAETTSLAQLAWERARQNNDFSEFSTHLKKVVDLKREEASLLSPNGELYDGLINDYEHGMTKKNISSIFETMKPQLLDLRSRINESKYLEPKLRNDFTSEKQLQLAHELAGGILL